jgi:hypothetical protein
VSRSVPKGGDGTVLAPSLGVARVDDWDAATSSAVADGAGQVAGSAHGS